MRIRMKRVAIGDKTVLAFKIPSYATDFIRELARKAHNDKYNDVLELDIGLPRRPRTKSQQGLLHVQIGLLALSKNVRPETMKVYIKTIAALKYGYPTEELDHVFVPKSEADATVDEESILINVTNELAMEWGINLEEIES